MVSFFPNKLNTLRTDSFKRGFVNPAYILKIFTSLFLILTLCMISFAEAQVNRVEVGDRVRVTAPFVDPMERIKGTVSEMSGSVLVLSKRDSLIYISDSLIQNLEVSTGKKRVIGEGLLIGAFTGTLLFGAVSAIIHDSCGSSENNCSPARSNGDAFVSGGKTGLITGTAVGALSGFFVQIDDWERAPVRLGIGVTSTRTDVDEWAMEPGISLKIPIGK